MYFEFLSIQFIQTFFFTILKMGRSATADEYLLTYLASLATKSTYSIGLILGQVK